MRKTKIICTLGPASANEETLEAMLGAGMNVARLNFSHGNHDQHRETIALFRGVRDRLNMPAAVLLDTKGPEIRLRTFKDGHATLTDGQTFILTTEQLEGTGERVSISYADLPRQLTPGNTVLLDDGRIALEVIGTSETEIETRVITGGRLTDRKGVNIPNVPLDMVYLSEQDKQDLLFGVEQDVDFIAASFARRAQDIIDMRKFLNYHGGHSIRIIAKIENIEGILNFDEILQESDGIMVARGDMGVEVDYERLPGLQKLFIRRCYQSGKMVITATQMLESMVVSASPTRAEITDVANAVFDGTSAVMLSGESAMGKYPVRAVEVMARIAEQAERDALAMNIYRRADYDTATGTTNAISDAACRAARDINAKCIIAVTKSGHTARSMSKYRPEQPIVAATPEVKTYHQLSLSWGVYPVVARLQNTSDDLFQHAMDCARQIDVAHPGDLVVIGAGIPLNTPGNTNTMRVATVGDPV